MSQAQYLLFLKLLCKSNITVRVVHFLLCDDAWLKPYNYELMAMHMLTSLLTLLTWDNMPHTTYIINTK